MSIEGKDFVIKEDEAPDNKKTGEAPSQDDIKKQPLPEVSFNSLIFSLSSSALLHLGEIDDPQSGARKKDLQMAKHSIDIIAMLKEKTNGNLTEEESGFIDNILTDLRLRYVKALK